MAVNSFADKLVKKVFGSSSDIFLKKARPVVAEINDAAQLRKKLTLAVNDKFAPIALDLSMIKLHPVAGFVERIADRDGPLTDDEVALLLRRICVVP